MSRLERTSVGRSALGGILWLLFQTGGSRVVGLVGQLVLARLMAPSQFGEISIVYAINALSGAVVNFGIDGVLLQRSRKNRLWLASSFWISLGLSLVGLCTVICASAVLGRVYHIPRMTELAAILGLGMPFGALLTLPSVMLRLEMNYRFPAVYGSVEAVVSQAMTIALAALGFGVFSFVLPGAICSFVKTVVYWLYKPVRLAGRLTKRHSSYLLGSGLRILGARLALEMIAQGDYVVLGFFAAQRDVGLYYFAYRLAAQPLWMLGGNFMNVLFPTLVQIETDPDRQLASAMRAASVLAHVVFPVCFLGAMVADPLVPVAFGSRWSASVPLVRLLGIGLAFDAVTWVSGSLLSARRDFSLALSFSMVRLPAFFALIAVGAAMGHGIGLAVAVMCYHIVHGPLVAAITFRRYGATVGSTLGLYAKPIALSCITCATLYFVGSLFSSMAVRFGVMVGAGLLIHPLLLRVVAPETLSDLSKAFGMPAALRRLLSARGLRNIPVLGARRHRG